MVVVPYPHAAAHQKANAAEMVEAGAAILVEDEHLDGGTLREACDLLFDVRLRAMSDAARSVARPGAAAAGARLLQVLAAGQPMPDQDELDRITRSTSVA
jgi:UDP-N-acetylglucosamine:LPS N-acetylglucosamine transferase